MAKKTHHSNYIKYSLVAGAVSTLGILGASQTVNAEQLTVKAGDTMWDLAQQHGIAMSSLEQANPSVKKVNDSIDLIYAGQQLTLPTSTDARQNLNADGTYTVKPGDTLGAIANRYHVSIQQLMAWNGLSATDSIYIGQHLSIDGTNEVASQPVQQQAVVSQAPVNSAVQANVSSSVVTTDGSQTTSSANNDVMLSQAPQATSNVAVNSSAIVSGSASASSSSAVSAVASTALASSNSENTPAIAANNMSASQAAATTTTVNVQQMAVQSTAPADMASLYTQSFVQVPTSQSQTQSTVAQSCSQPVNSSASAQTTTSVADQAQPQSQSTSTGEQQATQQTTPTQTTQAPAAATGQDLQHGSVVSLATKIANSNSVPYQWGGSNLSGTDCSGLVDYVYAHAENKQLPHNTVALESCVNQHAVSEAQPGDLLFWGNHGSTYHTAIYTGNNQYVAAAKPGTNVASYTISPYFQPSFAGTVK